MTWIYDDGGRKAAGYHGDARDCVVRAIAIVAEIDYAQAYALADGYGNTERKRKGCARTGIKKRTIDRLLKKMGFRWQPTMGIGTGCLVHLKAEELPPGRIIASCSRHIVAVIDGVVHDTYDPSRNGMRCVYGYWY